MYAITGVTGKVGGAVARALLADGQSVRAVVRNPDKGQVWKDRGCEVALATIEDEASLSVAFQGAEAVFVLVPCILALRSGGGKTERLRDHRVPGSKREAETVWSQIRSRYVFV